MNKEKLCTIYLVRHGETESNINGIVDGHFNAPLTEQGQEQARVLGKELQDIKFDAAFSSDLIRAKHTAELALLDRKLAVNATHLLRERFYGIYEGRHADQYYRDNQAMFEKIQNLTEEEIRKFKVYESMESEEEMVSRFITKLREIAVTFSGKNVLVVSHGSIMRAFVVHMGFGQREDFGGGTLKNTAYIVLESDGVDFFLKEIVGHIKNTNPFYS